MSAGIISKITLPSGSTYDIRDTTSGFITGMTILSYGSSTYADALAAYQANKMVYCRASSNSNPGTGNQLRMAFLAYVNNQTTPTEFEFQYYRSVSTHSDSQQGDQVYVYKLNSSGTWSVTTREAYTKVIAGSGLSSSYDSGAITLNHSNDVTAQTTQAIYPIKIDAQGHISEYGNAVTIPTAGSSATDVASGTSSTSGGSATTWSKSDHVHGIALDTGDSSGQVKIAGTNITVKNINNAAYKDVITEIIASGTGANKTSTDLPTTNAITSYVDGIASSLSNYIPKSTGTAAGQVLFFVGSGIPAVTGAGSAGQLLNRVSDGVIWNTQNVFNINGSKYQSVGSASSGATATATIFGPTSYGTTSQVLMGSGTNGAQSWKTVISAGTSVGSDNTYSPTTSKAVREYVASQVSNVDISSTYDSSTHTVTLTVGSLGDADNTEY